MKNETECFNQIIRCKGCSNKTIQSSLMSEDDEIFVITLLFLLYVKSMSVISTSSSSRTMVSEESLSRESVGWVANRDSRPSVNAVNHTSLSSKGTSSCTDASRFHAACFCRSPQILYLSDFCWDISLILRLHV